FREEDGMGAKAEALRLPGKGSGHRLEWSVVVAILLMAAVSVALWVMTTNQTATVPTPVRAPAPAKVAPVSGDGVRVGGTSVYRYHPLPATNVLVGDEPAGGTGAGKGSTGGSGSTGGNGARVGGSGSYRFHPLP